MKQYFRLILLLLLPLYSIGQIKKDHIEIIGKITGNLPDIIEYTLPINGIDYFGFTNSVQPDSLGNFQISLPLGKTSFIDLSNKNKSFGTLIAEPGMIYKIHINTEVKENQFRVASKNEKGQLLYNQIPNRMSVGGHFEVETKEYLKDSVPSNIKQQIKKSQEIELEGFKKLLKDKTISKNFYNLVRTDREYFYKGIQGSVSFINLLNLPYKENKLSEEQYKELWSEIFESNPVTNPEILSSSWFFHYAENYLRYKDLIIEGTTLTALSEINKQGLTHTHNINNAKKYLSGPQLEYYFAAYIHFETINKNYEKELITLFEQFKKEYPSSPYTPFLEPVIIPVLVFHKRQEEPLNEKIKFIPNSSTVNSVKEAIKGLYGKKFYVDIWATWCGPCKAEFKDNTKLYQLLKSKNITMVYISIDKESRENQWHDMIHFYNLEGIHIRANEKLNTDLINLYGNSSLAIPWHFLTDENGNVIKKRLSGASEVENLEKQLNE